MLARIQHQILIEILEFLVEVQDQVLVARVNEGKDHEGNRVEQWHDTAEDEAQHHDTMHLEKWVGSLELRSRVQLVNFRLERQLGGDLLFLRVKHRLLLLVDLAEDFPLGAYIDILPNLEEREWCHHQEASHHERATRQIVELTAEILRPFFVYRLRDHHQHNRHHEKLRREQIQPAILLGVERGVTAQLGLNELRHRDRERQEDPESEQARSECLRLELVLMLEPLIANVWYIFAKVQAPSPVAVGGIASTEA